MSTQHVRNILKLYRKANADDITAGLEWYDRAKRAALLMSHKYDLPVTTIVGVMAALSPNNRWERNVRDAEHMVYCYTNNSTKEDAFTGVCTYTNNKQKSWDMLLEQMETHDEILAKLNGQKTRSFYSNIIGLDEVTIDGHAYNIARNQRVNLTDDKTNIGKRLYRELQAAYIRAAEIAGVKPHEMQAITWTAWKRIHNI